MSLTLWKLLFFFSLFFSEHCLARDLIYKIGFGSCFKKYPHQKGPVLRHLADRSPDLFIWLGMALSFSYHFRRAGDVAYTDIPIVPGFSVSNPDKAKVRSRFENSYNDPGFPKNFIPNYQRKYFFFSLFFFWCFSSIFMISLVIAA